MVQDEKNLRTAWAWAENAPRWFTESQDKETEEDFLSTADEKLFYGIFDKEMTALIRLTPYSGKVFEIDLFADRKTDLNVLTEAGLSVRDYLIDKGIAKGFFGWISRQNRGIRKLYASLGFTACGIKCYRGKTHGRPVEWLLMTR